MWRVLMQILSPAFSSFLWQKLRKFPRVSTWSAANKEDTWSTKLHVSFIHCGIACSIWKQDSNLAHFWFSQANKAIKWTFQSQIFQSHQAFIFYSSVQALSIVIVCLSFWQSDAHTKQTSTNCWEGPLLPTTAGGLSVHWCTSPAV